MRFILAFLFGISPAFADGVSWNVNPLSVPKVVAICTVVSTTYTLQYSTGNIVGNSCGRTGVGAFTISFTSGTFTAQTSFGCQVQNLNHTIYSGVFPASAVSATATIYGTTPGVAADDPFILTCWGR